MKRIVIGFAVFLFIMLNTRTVDVGKNSRDQAMPLPTELSVRHAKNEQRRLFKQNREKWIEQMHRSAPNQNWRDIDNENRSQLASARLKLRKQKKAASVKDMRSQFGNSGPGSVHLANGLLGSWQERGSSNQAGRTIRSIYNETNNQLNVYSAGGNLWQADFDLQNWNVVDDNLRLSDGDFEYFNDINEVLLVASNSPGGLFSSSDGGQNWQHAPINLSNSLRVRDLLIPDQQGTQALASYQHWHWIGSWVRAVTLFSSTDRGSTVQQFGPTGQFVNGDALAMFSPRFGSSQTFLVHEDQFYSVDIGSQSLNLLATVPLNFAPGSITQTVMSGGIDNNGNLFIYIAYDIGSQTRVYRSNDGGLSWVSAGTAPTYMFSSHSFASSTINPNLLITGGINAWYSLNGGANWSIVNSWVDYYDQPISKLHADIVSFEHFYSIIGGGEQLLINTDGGVYLSSDFGQSVFNLSQQGLGVSQYYSSYTQRNPPYAIHAGAQDQGYQKASSSLIDGVIAFRQSISGDYGHLVSGDGGESVWTNYPGFSMYYPFGELSDSEDRWGFSGNGFVGALWLPPLVADPNDPTVVYLAGGRLGGTGHHLIKLTHDGNNIQAVQQPFNFGSTITAVEISALDSQRQFVITSNLEFFHSKDGGQSWYLSPNFTAPANHYFYGAKILASKTDSDLLWVAGSGYSGPGVFESRDGGHSFTPLSTGLPATLVHDLDISADDDWLFAATEVGAFYYDRSQNTWVDAVQNTGPDQLYWDVDYIPALQTARFSTYGRGLWDLKLSRVRGKLAAP